jgi:hypothetical protein
MFPKLAIPGSCGNITEMHSLSSPSASWEWTPEYWNYPINNCVLGVIPIILITKVYIVEFPKHHMQSEQCLLTCRNPAICSDSYKDGILPAGGQDRKVWQG